jgi:hypothetical protein
LIDRITDRANIVETGTESYRFRRTLKNARPKVWKLRASSAPPLALASGGKIFTSWNFELLRENEKRCDQNA